MKYIAHIDIMPLKNLLDPQGKAVKHTLESLQFSNVTKVRIGKHIDLELDAKSKEEAKINTQKICEKVLVNQIMESYTITINDYTEETK